MRHRANLPPSSVRNRDIRELSLSNLRKAIRANWVSFPSQIPALPSCRWPGPEHKLVQLYFVMGWSCRQIAARYGMSHQQVRCILNAWRWRAANAGYLQHIPPAETGRRLAELRSSLGVDVVGEPVPAR